MKPDQLWACILATSLGACVHGSVGGAVDSEGRVGVGGSLHVTTEEPSEADLAAARVVETLWPQVIVGCGETYFALVRPPSGEERRLTEYWGMTRIVRPEEITEADREVGVEWQGYTKMRAAFKRWHRPDGTWSGWSSCGELATVPLKLIGEEWDASAARSALIEAGFASPPDCSTLPLRPSTLPSPATRLP